MASVPSDKNQLRFINLLFSPDIREQTILANVKPIHIVTFFYFIHITRSCCVFCVISYLIYSETAMKETTLRNGIIQYNPISSVC